MKNQIEVGQPVTVRGVACEVVAVHPLGAIDVKESNGDRCWRMSGLPLSDAINRYSDVVARGLILPKKAKYTKRDVDAVLLDSLFAGPRTLTIQEARFVVRCSAVHHDAEYSPACHSI
jgi:hypothetical protein